MKRIKTIVTMLTAAAILFLVPDSTRLEASADEPVTYAVKYVNDEVGWRFQSGTSTFDDAGYHRELYYLYESMKDGDLVVVYNDSASVKPLDLGDVHLSNLTVVQSSSFAVIYSGDIDDCFILANTACSINANVKNAHVYDVVTCSFNGNVEEMTVYVEKDWPGSTIGCGGTVGHFHMYALNEGRTFKDAYNFQKETLIVQNGSFVTPDWAYSTEPPQAATQTGTQSGSQQQSSGASSSSSSDEYDDVPKTGDFNAALWLVCAAALCMTGSCRLRKSAK